MLLDPDKSHDFYAKAIDQWSLGILAYELIVGKALFEMKGEQAKKKKIANFKGKVKFPSHVSTSAEEFVREVS